MIINRMSSNSYNIAVLVTCHNKKKKTLESLHSLFASLDTYNQSGVDKPLIIKLFLTDDGCTDQTKETVLKEFKGKDIEIIDGNGNLFWAGGMRVAWSAAIKDSKDWDFYLLLNDDTILYKDALIELIKTHSYALCTYKKAGVYSGVVCSTHNKDEITYGGKIYTSRFIGKSESIIPNGVPQECQLTNANILLVSKDVQKEIGILDPDYRHSCADWAYGIEASKKGFPVLITSKVCGTCDNDHDSELKVRDKLRKMSLKERYEYFSFPTHSTKDILVFMWHYNKLKFFMVIIARTINILFPNLYYKLDKQR